MKEIKIKNAFESYLTIISKNKNLFFMNTDPSSYCNHSILVTLNKSMFTCDKNIQFDELYDLMEWFKKNEGYINEELFDIFLSFADDEDFYEFSSFSFDSLIYYLLKGKLLWK